jgi:hypothetical protein
MPAIEQTARQGVPLWHKQHGTIRSYRALPASYRRIAERLSARLL